jgi:hypothetical protein
MNSVSHCLNIQTTREFPDCQVQASSIIFYLITGKDIAPILPALLYSCCVLWVFLRESPAGFLTVDRSSKNPGWYWFYEDQAHAWVQIFFPGYGWIDFDTTIPDVNTQQAPQPDETPPLNMQDAYFVADGIVTSIDTITKRMTADVSKILFMIKTMKQQMQRISKWMFPSPPFHATQAWFL